MVPRNTYSSIKCRSNTQPRAILMTLYSPPLDGGIFWGVGTVCGRTLTYPLRFNTWGTREIDVRVQGRTRVGFYEKKMFRSEIRACVLDDVKCEGCTCRTIGVKDRSITQPRVIIITVYRYTCIYTTR